MKISIITPTFNSANTVLDTCKSICEQSNKNFEHIIIDNLSKDSTLEIIKSYYNKVGLSKNLFIYCEKDSGISDAFNRGISKAKGDIIAILNSDDYYLNSNLFEDILQIFSSSNNLLIHGDMFFEDHTFGSNIRHPLLCKIEYGMPINHPTCFVHKTLYEKYGNFKREYKFAMDFEWLSRFYKYKLSTEIYYFKLYPITFMRGSGVSAKFEEKTLFEVKNALITSDNWNLYAKKFYIERICRIKMKIFLTRFNLSSLIKIWRLLKWRNFN